MITMTRSITTMIANMIKILNLHLVTRACGQEGLHCWRRRPGGRRGAQEAKVVAAAPSDE